jgi:alkylation response protein AidB-like acyl-CoA dehydrogenase
MQMISRTPFPQDTTALRQAVRDFLKDRLVGTPPELRAASWLGFDADFSRDLAARGWVGLTLPHEYGGGGRSPFERFVLLEELLAAGAPVSAHWIADRQHGPMLVKYGTEAQRRLYLPLICRAEAFFCIGMSEPQSGSDLASVRSRAVKVAQGWRLTGQKVWTTNAHRSHYMVALVRTSGTSEDRHKGLSQFIVDLSLPGITVRPIKDITGHAHFSEVFFDDVLLTDDALVGAEGAGWEQVTAELGFERSGPERLYSSVVLVDTWLAWLRASDSADRSAVALAGKLAVHLAVLRAMSMAVTAKLARNEKLNTEAALVKDLGTSFEQFVPQAIADALGAHPESAIGSSLRRTLAYVTQISPSFSLRGGTREILRGIVAKGIGVE